MSVCVGVTLTAVGTQIEGYCSSDIGMSEGVLVGSVSVNGVRV